MRPLSQDEVLEISWTVSAGVPFLKRFENRRWFNEVQWQWFSHFLQMIFPLQFYVSYTILVLKFLQIFGQLACRDRQEAVEFLSPAEVPFAKDSTEVWVQDVSFL